MLGHQNHFKRLVLAGHRLSGHVEVYSRIGGAAGRGEVLEGAQLGVAHGRPAMDGVLSNFETMTSNQKLVLAPAGRFETTSKMCSNR